MNETNKWKRYFFYLLIVNIFVILTIAVLIFWPVSEDSTYNKSEGSDQENSEFIVRTTKNNLNELVNAYIEQLLDGTKHYYRVSLDDDVHLLGDLPLFSTTVPISIHLEPFVQNDGNVILKQRSISVGKLQLPNKKIMEYIKRYLKMPDWVKVDPNKEEIYVAVTEMQTKSNFKISVERFDLRGNNLAFKINIPYQTLGIDRLEAKKRH